MHFWCFSPQHVGLLHQPQQMNTGLYPGPPNMWIGGEWVSFHSFHILALPPNDLGKEAVVGGWHKQACLKKRATKVIGEGNPRDQFSKVENKWNLGHLSLLIATASPKLKCKQTRGHTSPCLGGSSSEVRVLFFRLVILIDFTSTLASGKAECGFQWLLIMPSEGRF